MGGIKVEGDPLAIHGKRELILEAEKVLKAALEYAMAEDAYSDHPGFSEYEDGNKETRKRIEKECREAVETTNEALRTAALRYRTVYDNSYWP